MLNIKRIVAYISIVAIALIISSCSVFKAEETHKLETEYIEATPTLFDKDLAYLSEKGVRLPELSSDSHLGLETFLSLLVEAYESLGNEIDISKVNSRNVASDAVKKLTLIGTYDRYFMGDDLLDDDLDYGSAAYLLMKLQDSIQQRLYWNRDFTATTGDLLRRMNVSTALHTWKEDVDKVRTYSIEDLLRDGSNLNQPLTRLMIAEMMVSTYEELIGDIQFDEALKPNDTDNMYAWKSNQLFFWTESGDFEPEKTGNWNDWAFMSAIIFDSQLRVGLKLEESRVPYGAVVSALASLMREREGLQLNFIEEKIVLNERPFDWHVYQQETGEYGAVNCMPSCVEMAVRFQSLPDVPSAEQLRKNHPLDGLGWNDVLAENVMLQYGVQLDHSFDVNLEKMLTYLDGGNVLYVMFRELESQEGHSVIIKGYWELGGVVHFIVSDPDYIMVGPFGYLEYIKDAHTMISDIERHVPRYFIISGAVF